MAGSEDKDQKTELPTPRKLEKAIEQGDVFKSQEVLSFFVLGAATLAFMISSGWMTRDLAGRMRIFLDNIHQISIDRAGLMSIGWFAVAAVLAAVALPFLFGVVASIAGNVVQNMPVWSVQPITPKFSKISPMSGLKRMFGKEALVNFGKGLVKIAVVGTIIVMALWPQRGFFESMASTDVASLLPKSYAIMMNVMVSVLAIVALIAVLDYVYQRHAWIERHKMSKQEIKEEYKESEGSPEIKQKIAQLRQQVARRRMMSNVPKASVVIMNPTHYAVALKYEAGMDAPICVAKGMDELALRIKAVAIENEVPVVENPPLARALHAAVNLDETIPEDQYKAVAEVIGYVMRTRKRRLI
jgi:flagellar biosynthesis protein FlhB